MKPRERVLTALAHEEPDRVPMAFVGITTEAYERLKKYLNIVTHEGAIDDWSFAHGWGPAEVDEKILKKFEIDFRTISLKPPKNWKLKKYLDGSFKDEWGIIFKRVGKYHEMVDWPLKNAFKEDLEEYDWPDPHAPGRTEGLEKEAKQLYENTDYAIEGTDIMMTIGVLEIASWLRKLDKFLIDMIRDPDFANACMDKVLEIKLGFCDEFLGAVGDYIQIVDLSDDLGMQTGMLMSPDLYRKMVKPKHKKLIRFIKKRTDAKVRLHSCGSIKPIIPDLIEIGVDILNPIQPLAFDMESDKLKKEFGDKLCFHGGIDIQQALPFGTPKDVEEEVKKRIKTFAVGGGYILGPAHNFQPDVKPENICAMYEAGKKFDAYSIKL